MGRNRMWIVIALLSIAPAVPSVAGPARGMSVKGGLWITTDASRTTLTVASPSQDFVVFLPWADDWMLESTRDAPLTGVNENYTVTLSHRRRGDDTARDVLEEALDELLSFAADVRFLQFVEREGQEVLALQIRHSETGPWHWFYWVLLPAKKGWLQLTVLAADPGELAPLDIELVEAMARSTRLSTILGEDPARSPEAAPREEDIARGQTDSVSERP